MIRQDGTAFIVTVLVLVEIQPDEFEVVRVRVNVPLVPAVTVIDDPVVEPLIVPLPLISQS